MQTTRACRWTLGLLGVVVASSVHAEEPSAADVAAARELGREGVKLADAGKCGDAIPKLKDAAAIVAAPTLLARLGECQIGVGLLVEGTETLQRVTREKLPPNAPEAYVAAHLRAEKSLEQALPRVPRLRLVITPDTARANVVVDGAPVPASLAAAARPTNPGVRHVAVSAPGFVAVTRDVTLREGATEVVEIALAPAPDVAPIAPPSASAPPPPVVASTASAPPPPPPPAPPPREPPSRTAAYVAFGVGGAGLAFGAVLGVVALGKRNDLQGRCVDKACPPGSSSDISSLSTTATLSTVGFAVGVVGAGVGTYLLLREAPSGAQVGATLGPGSVGLAGRW